MTARIVAFGLAMAVIIGCGGPPRPTEPGRALKTRVLASFGPAVPMGSMLAATDLSELRAEVDAADQATATRFGATATHRTCEPPTGCWQGARPDPGSLVIALVLQYGFCLDVSSPEAHYASGSGITLVQSSSQHSDCHVNGVLAAPSAALVQVDVSAVPPGLVSVSYRWEDGDGVYQSARTYVSLPALPAVEQSREEPRLADAIHRVSSSSAGGDSQLFAITRVDGAQVGNLCRITAAGDVYLVTDWRTDTNPRQSRISAVTPTGVHLCSTQPA